MCLNSEKKQKSQQRIMEGGKKELNLSPTSSDLDLDILDFHLPWLHESRFINCDICQKVVPMFELGSHRYSHFSLLKNVVKNSKIAINFWCKHCGKNFHAQKHFMSHLKNCSRNSFAGKEVPKLQPKPNSQRCDACQMGAFCDYSHH